LSKDDFLLSQDTKDLENIPSLYSSCPFVVETMANQLKKLVVYYSLDGTTAAIAKTIADTVGADIIELRPKDPIKSSANFLTKLLIGGMQVFLKKQPELLPFEKNPADYDLVFLGTPIWVSNHTPAIRTFLATTPLRQKRIALFCCCRSVFGKAFDNMKQALSGNTIVGEISFRQLGNNTQKAAEWAQKIVADANR
jgi:flavodoxin